MNIKKTFAVFSTLLFIPLSSISAQDFQLPMGIWGSLQKTDGVTTTDLPVGTQVKFSDTSGEIDTLTTIVDGQYGKRGPIGGDIGFYNTTALTMKISEDGGGNWYTVPSSAITAGSGNDANCPSADAIISEPGLECEYNILIDSSTANPTAISDLSATETGGTSINLNWNASTDADSYEIYRSTSSPVATSGTPLTTTTETTFTDTGLTVGTRYYYTIVAVNTNGSTQGNETSSLSNTPPATPVLSMEAQNSYQIKLNWNASSDTDFSKYEILRKGGSSSSYEVVKTLTSKTQSTYTDDSLSSETTYYYKIRVTDSANQSSTSSEKVATTDEADTSSSTSSSSSSGGSSSGGRSSGGSSGGGGGGGGGATGSCARPAYTDIYPPRNTVVKSADTISFTASNVQFESSIKVEINDEEIENEIDPQGSGVFNVEATIPEKYQTEGEFQVSLYAENGGGCTRKTVYMVGISEDGVSLSSGSSNRELTDAGVLPRSTSTGENFSDMYAPWGTHWAFDYVLTLKDMGIVSGKNGNFAPDSEITRAELLKLVVESNFSREEIDSCLDTNADPNWTYLFFPDVDRIAWYGPYVCMGKVHEIVNGYRDGTFKPNNVVTRSEALKIIIEAEGNGSQDSCLGTHTKPDWSYIFFNDVDPIAWYGPYICEAKTQGYTSGYQDGTYQPNRSISRAEAAKFTVEIFGF